MLGQLWKHFDLLFFCNSLFLKPGLLWVQGAGCSSFPHSSFENGGISQRLSQALKKTIPRDGSRGIPIPASLSPSRQQTKLNLGRVWGPFSLLQLGSEILSTPAVVALWTQLRTDAPSLEFPAGRALFPAGNWSKLVCLPEFCSNPLH